MLDGGTGSEIQARGVPMDGEAWSALANVTHPDVVRSVHEDFIRAGAQVVIANTFAAGPGPLGERFADVNRAAVRLAREARARAAAPHVAIAGSLSVMAFHGLEQDRHVGAERIADAYRAQAEVLAAVDVDLLVLEMMCEAEHALPALAAATATGLPVWFGVSALGTLTVRGVDLGVFLDEVLAQPARPEALLVMHTELDDVAPALDVVGERFAGPIGAYPHRGTWTPPEWTFAGIAPDEFAARMSGLRDRGASLLGGCCGIRPEHIAALSAALQAR